MFDDGQCPEAVVFQLPGRTSSGDALLDLEIRRGREKYISEPLSLMSAWQSVQS
jgi:hypothetical protein